MTNFRVSRFNFDHKSILEASLRAEISQNWPVVYTLQNDKEIYVGETVNAIARLGQHLNSPQRAGLECVQIILNERFNKSACLDLESQLIQYFAADGRYRVQNANAGISNADYFDRQMYRESFNELFDLLVTDGLLSRPVPEIVNSNLFKYSPFKALNNEQALAVTSILEQIIQSKKSSSKVKILVEGGPGTGKTIVAIYLMKLIMDITNLKDSNVPEIDSIFTEYLTVENRDLLANFKIGLVIPQQSLRSTISKVFRVTPGLDKSMVLNAFDVGKAKEKWDLLIVDESHRLSMRANQAHPTLNTKYANTNVALFGSDNLNYTQLDWIIAQSTSQVLLVDVAQSIKPADLPKTALTKQISEAKSVGSYFRLNSQLRVAGGNEYIEFVDNLFTDNPSKSADITGYDLKFFESFAEMRDEVMKREAEVGLSRVLSGYAWDWVSKKNPQEPDIKIEGLRLFWNRTDKDWLNSATSVEEVGSIHTIQGYDLNYAGVVIGKDLVFDEANKKIVFNRRNYFDKKGLLNNRQLGIYYSDEDFKEWVLNIYRVLLTRGIKGTYIYVHDEALRKHLSPLFIQN